ncbi:MAG: MFS transporter, partial [Paracoccaceae bacterium]
MTILALWATGLGAAAQFAKMSVIFADLGQTYVGQSPAAIGLLVSVVGMVGLIFGTTSGLVVARLGQRRCMLAALTLAVAVSLIQSALPPYPLMLLTRVAEGAAHLAVMVIGPPALAAVAPVRWQAAVLALWSTIFG